MAINFYCKVNNTKNQISKTLSIEVFFDDPIWRQRIQSRRESSSESNFSICSGIEDIGIDYSLIGNSQCSCLKREVTIGFFLKILYLRFY